MIDEKYAEQTPKYKVGMSMYNERAVKPYTSIGMIIGRIFYVVAAIAFAIALGALIASGHDAQVLMSSAQGLGVLTNGYQAIQELVQAIAIWLIMMTAGLISTVFGLICASFK
jgi:hypothetical protein